jgi:hypothetical protein
VVKCYGFGDRSNLTDSQVILQRLHDILNFLGADQSVAVARVYDQLNTQGLITCQSEEQRDLLIAVYERIPASHPIKEFKTRAVVLAQEHPAAKNPHSLVLRTDRQVACHVTSN